MWNNSSRSRWLVNRVDSLRRRASTATHSASSLLSIPNFYSKKKCRPLQATRQSSRRDAIINTTTTRAQQSSTAETRGAPSRVTACPNQIIVVLFNVLLANCVISSVARTLAVTAAFGAPSPLDDVRFGVAPAPHYHNRHSHLLEHESYLLGGNNNNNNYYNDNDNNNNNEDNIDDNYVVDRKTAAIQLQRSQNFKISPKPCSIGRIEGTCMFVWECIKSEGRHVGMCVDSFMFGSCCSHNTSDNIVLSETFSYTRPTKPVGISSVNHKPRPPHFPQRPNISGMTTIERPHGAGTLVIRPSGPHHQGVLFKPHHLPTKTRPSFSSTSTTTTIGKTTQVPTTTTTTTTTTNTMFSSPSMSIDMQSAASVPATNMWHTSPETTHQHHHHHHHHWQLPTEPSFITKPRPPSWEKPTSMRPKPPKPSKKPIMSDHPSQQHQQQQHQPPQADSLQPTGKPTPTTMRPKPQIFNTKPMTTTTSTLRPYFRPTAGWSGSASTSGTTSASSSPSPSPSSSSSSSITTQRHTSTTQAPTSAQLPQLPQQHQQLLIITRPTTSPATATTSSTTAQTAISTVAMHQHQPDHQHYQQFNHHHHHHQQQQHHEQTPSTLNLSTMESNEIVESSSSNTKLATIKTITAARSECGIPVLQRPETRIVGGKSAPFGRWPWQVSVRRTSFFGFSSTHRCGGALINENWIATAGHCVDDLLISQIRIRVGEYDFSHVQEQLPYIERGVAKKVVHPKYNFFTYEYDLALVKLEQPLEFAPHVSPICLPQTDSLLIGMNATVTGWGRLSEGGTLPSVLQEVSVPIVSNDNCKTMFLRAGRQEFIPDIFLCAGYETGGQDSCQGDSGGPLQVKSQDGRFFLAGIISWGIGCAEANLPGVCTRISKFVPWIMDNVT